MLGKSVYMNIMPRVHDTEVDYQRLLVMYAMGTGLQIDIPRQMFLQLTEHVGSLLRQRGNSFFGYSYRDYQ